MKIYLVGGAVRDKLLGLPIKDRDWVVVGSTPKQMLNLGYEQVGSSFPVFIHPDTKEEYALARTEIKTGIGYHGFEVKCTSRITLEQDLWRRDLTINAIAYDPKTKEYIDPFNGIHDLRNGILRHVSEAFTDDPVRIMRVARFQARYGNKFRINPYTQTLMVRLVNDGELDYLTPERVWLEFEKAIMEKEPELFFLILERCGAFGRLFPEFTNTFSIMLPNTFYLRMATMHHLQLKERIIAFLYDRPKAVDMLLRLKAPQNIIRLLKMFQILYKTTLNQKLTSSDAIKLFEEMDAFRHPDDFIVVIRLAQIFDMIRDKANILNSIFTPVLRIGFNDLTVSERNRLEGIAIGEAIRRRRIFEATKVLRW
jgi:tRNA nucleotidyltransferase (CCA-adding enzyme)